MLVPASVDVVGDAYRIAANYFRQTGRTGQLRDLAVRKGLAE